jgi:hypothetical protein
MGLMRPSTLLRVASILSLLLFAGHSSGFPWTPDRSAATDSLIGQMKSLHFGVMGFSRTYWDFYVGFGLTISVLLLLAAVILWQLASDAKTAPRKTRPFIGMFLAGFTSIAILDWVYFFTAPLVLSIAIAICLAFAWVSAWKAAEGER